MIGGLPHTFFASTAPLVFHPSTCRFQAVCARRHRQQRSSTRKGRGAGSHLHCPRCRVPQLSLHVKFHWLLP